MLPIIIASHNRHELLKQEVESLLKNSDGPIQIIIIDDSGTESYNAICKFIETLKPDVVFYHFKSQTTIGQSKLKGVEFAVKDKYIYFSDDDMYFLPHWDTIMMQAFEIYDDLVIVGGRGVHGARDIRSFPEGYSVGICDLQTGYSMMMKREDWDKWGHFPNYNEDSWISFEMRTQSGKNIGVIDPPVLIHCGYARVSRQDISMTDKPADYAGIEEDMARYPELLFD